MHFELAGLFLGRVAEVAMLAEEFFVRTAVPMLEDIHIVGTLCSSQAALTCSKNTSFHHGFLSAPSPTPARMNWS